MTREFWSQNIQNHQQNTQNQTKNLFLQVDFWKSPTVQNTNVDVMIRADQMGWFRRFLNDTQIEYKVLVEDLEKLVSVVLVTFKKNFLDWSTKKKVRTA